MGYSGGIARGTINSPKPGLRDTSRRPPTGDDGHGPAFFIHATGSGKEIKARRLFLGQYVAGPKNLRSQPLADYEVDIRRGASSPRRKQLRSAVTI